MSFLRIILLLEPVFDVIYTLDIVAEVAVFGKPPPINVTNNPEGLHIVEEIVNGEKPLLVGVILEEGLNIPMLYSITATMTIIRIAQP